MTAPRTGPLAGIRVIELASLGPVPFAAMMLSDLGAEVVRVDRPPGKSSLDTGDPRTEILFRGRRSICVDLSHPSGHEVLLTIAESADVLLEGNRPGVAERLGIGPNDLHAINPGLVYVRATGWGQDGPLAARAGHDLTYTAITGALAAIGEAGRKPVPALNLISDFGGGGTFVVIGVLAALQERQRSGLGQVVDAAMVDGATYLLSSVLTMLNREQWTLERGRNVIDGGAPFYDTYVCLDGGYIAIGALEPKFWRTVVDQLDLGVDPNTQWDTSTWPDLRERLATAFATRSRDEWAAQLEPLDACVAPVLTLAEAADHPHLAERGTLRRENGSVVPAPAPRFDRTPGQFGATPEVPGQSTRSILLEHGLTLDDISRLESEHAIIDTNLQGT